MPHPDLRYSTTEGSCLWCSVCSVVTGVLVSATIAGLGMAFLPPEVNLDFGDFMKTDIPTSATRDAFLASLGHLEEDRRLVQEVYHFWDVVLIYELGASAGNFSEWGPGVLDPGVVSSIAAFETQLKQVPAWQQMCGDIPARYRNFCEVGISFANYLLPTRNVSQGDVVPIFLNLDGGGKDPVPLTVALDLVQQQDTQTKIFPEDFQFANPSTSSIRSVFRFMYPCCLTNETLKQQKAQSDANKAKWRKMTAEVVTFIDARKNIGNVRVYFDGYGFAGFQVTQALTNDVALASISMAFVLLYMIGHTRSLLLGILGLMIIVTAIPVAYVVSAVITGNQTLSLASFLSLFLVVGIGSDVVFVYSDFWKASANILTCRNERDRLLWTFKHAGKASLATTATTAASFFANLASILKSLRDFGFFMGMCVMMVWVLVSAVFLPLCLVDERCCAPCFKCCFGGRRSRGSSRWLCKAGSGPTVDKWVNGLSSVMVPVVSLCFLLAVGAGIWGGMVGTTSASVPGIFPDDHNQIQMPIAAERFASLEKVLGYDAMPTGVHMTVCGDQEFNAELNGCSAHWCEVSAGTAVTDPHQCVCLRKPHGAPCQGQPTAYVKQRFVHRSPSQVSTLEGVVGDFLINGSEGVDFSSATRDDDLQSVTKLPPLVVQDWYSGTVTVQPMTDISVRLRREDVTTSSCGWTDICYCDVKPCAAPAAWQMIPGPRLSARRLQSGQSSALGQWEIPVEQHAIVDVTFGLKLTSAASFLGKVDLDNSWSFSDAFDHRDPWAQRNMLKFCEDLPEVLRVSKKACWIEHFRDWTLAQQLRFPVLESSFDSKVTEFMNQILMDSVQPKTYFWMRDGRVKASRMLFWIDVHKQAPAFKSMGHKADWDQYVNDYESKASSTAKGAIQTSQLWVQAEAVRELIASTVQTMVIAVVVGFVGMLIVTLDFLLSFFVVLATCGVVCLLLTFMVVVMQWVIGPIEIVALIAFIGYAMTYSLHIAHRYSTHRGADDDLARRPRNATAVRLARVGFALRTIGMAALGSANTTVGCAVPLLFCTLTIFVKLGAVVLVVTVFSIIAAFVPLPAALLWLGPVEPGFMVRQLVGMVTGKKVTRQSTEPPQPEVPPPPLPEEAECQPPQI